MFAAAAVYNTGVADIWAQGSGSWLLPVPDMKGTGDYNEKNRRIFGRRV